MLQVLNPFVLHVVLYDYGTLYDSQKLTTFIRFRLGACLISDFFTAHESSSTLSCADSRATTYSSTPAEKLHAFSYTHTRGGYRILNVAGKTI